MNLGLGNAIILSQEFKDILADMSSNPNPLFITGRAGTGKSTLLKLFTKTEKRNTVVLAPTGIAALNIKGQTIHSFFGFPPRLLLPEDIHVRRNRSMFKNLEIMIIDEISMVKSVLLDNIDQFLRLNRNIDLPFGGVKVMFFGDLFQLPPVISSVEERNYINENYETPYFFSAHVIQEYGELITHELQEVHRQKDRHFINILDNIRQRTVDYDDLNDLNERYIPDFEDDEYYITLCARNAQVREINKTKLAELESEEFTYLAQITGDFSDRLFPTNMALKLRVGAQVMCIQNDPERRFVNGTIGKIVDLDSDIIKISIKNDNGDYKIIELEQNEWEIIKYKLDPKKPKDIKVETIGKFKQYPIRLAWAITIHKSQGKTFERVIIDLGKGSFQSGQTYVALSRCTTMEGIVLRNPLKPKDILVDPVITEFYQDMR